MDRLKFLTPEQKESWIKNGFIKVSGIYSQKEFDELNVAYNELFYCKQRENIKGLESAWVGNDMRKEAGYIDYTESQYIKKVKSIHNLQMHSAAFTKAISNPKFLDAVEDILGTEDILLHHTKAHIKPPENGVPYLVHQDYPYFPFKKHTMFAAFLHMDDATRENGGLAVYPGSHKLGPLEDFGVKDEKGETYHWVDPKKYPLSGATPVPAKQGDIVFFSYLLLDGSYLNLSKKTRRMYLVQLRVADDEPVEPVHQSPCQNLVLRGKNIQWTANMATRFNASLTIASK